MNHARPILFLAVLALAAPNRASAGMPTPLPLPPPRIVKQLNESIEYRLQAISFFLLVLLICALVVWRLWNYLQRDFPSWPRLSFLKALAAVILWGLLFVIVLAMIGGARELMTPGAWKKTGITYELINKERAVEADPVPLRKQHLERLRTALWHYAAMHDGRFPGKAEINEIADELWTVPDAGGRRYLYVPGQSAGSAPALLAWEPELESERRFALQTNGEIVSLRSADLPASSKPETGP
jgi:hypothetical protein